ncbi:alpha/beta fold hydrolase [Curtobacterium sp. VKM Ac-1395]|uniref:alpha/beta fold hydrolase n=1 Tax=Curtobacterium sp. VKM Ac-1395 TaxID=2783815 RepID=UPI00188C8AB2|nr:alpha/beta hydrolase [Curtobacterium sp. VKM Ac-1395]MBF4589133.1 alpha/beta hydrolase [Curtobacterium sp. VKM Ac-1395]
MHVIMVPGFWLEADAWDEVVPVLREAGHSVEALTRDGDTLDEQVAALVERLDDVATPEEPVALVGHSGAGPIAYMALDRRPSLVQHLVYVDTFPGPEGGCVNDELPVVDGGVPLPAWDFWEPATVRGMTAELRTAFEHRAVPEPAAVPSDPFHYEDAARHTVPATVITCEISPADLAAMVADHQTWAAELVATEELSIVGLDTGHWPMFTAPVALGDLIVRALAPKPTDGP